MDRIPVQDRPPVWLPFQTFHLMVGLGTAMLLLAGAGCWSWYRGKLETQRGLLWCLVLSPLAAMAANQAGWVTAEVGRQPWIVYPSVQNGVEMMGMRTSEGLSESVTAEQVLASIVMFSVIYSALFFIWIFVLNSKIQHGPEAAHQRNPESLREQVSHRASSRAGSLVEPD
jgi:cytochrome bd ubiquinol oxidase subunit I